MASKLVWTTLRPFPHRGTEGHTEEVGAEALVEAEDGAEAAVGATTGHPVREVEGGVVAEGEASSRRAGRASLRGSGERSIKPSHDKVLPGKLSI